MELSDVGKEVELRFHRQFRVKVIMGVIHSRGHLFLFAPEFPPTSKPLIDKQVQAIQAFMKFCKEGGERE